MHFNTLVLAALAAVAFGQTTTSSAPATTSTSTCAAQNILDACLSTEQASVNSCTANDWDCLCTAWGNVLTCYNNCPADSGVFGAQQSKTQFCNAASAYGTKTSSATSLGASATGSATAANPFAVTTSDTTGTATGSSATATATHNAASGLHVGSGMVAVVIAGLGLLA